MQISIIVPSPGESITEVELSKWLVENESQVEINQDIAEIDSDKATLTITAPESGKIFLKAAEGDTVAVGDEIAIIDTDFKTNALKKPESDKKLDKILAKEEEKSTNEPLIPEIVFSPQAKQMLESKQINSENLLSDDLQGKRITKKDVLSVIADVISKNQPNNSDTKVLLKKEREIQEVKMSSLRRKLSERLVNVKNQTAMLTTFNEIDMSHLMTFRNSNQKRFTDKYGIKLGMMSFFAKASTLALQQYPNIQAQIENDTIHYFNYTDIGIAVSTEKGLMVPVIRNTQSKSIAQIETELYELAQKARNNKISIEEMSGGTFTITNGGVFGSMLSTPIINPPQSAILGMHNIVERPVVLNGKIEIRPIMYVALSYDHRIIDGKDSVGFVVKIKDYIENPFKMLSKQENPNEELLEFA